MAGLRERQKAGRRRDILAAAAKLFRRDGFTDTAIEAIAAEADVATGTVYNYFESKGDLLIALAALDAKTAGDVLFEVVNSLFMIFVAREEMPVAQLKKRLTRQVRLVFAGLGNTKTVE